MSESKKYNSPTNPPPARRSSEQRSQAARSNGAKSKGPKTAAGKARSSQNAAKHGAYSCDHLLANENHPLYDQFFKSYLEQFLPSTPLEIQLVEQMCFAHWRIRRLWAGQDSLIDLEMTRTAAQFAREFHSGSESARLAFALESLYQKSSGYHHMHTLEFRLSRQFSRALADLFRLRALNQSQPQPQPAQAKSDETNPTPSQPSQNSKFIDDIYAKFPHLFAHFSTDQPAPAPGVIPIIPPRLPL
jgi:hypothetical protein